jgi:putative hydrolase of HD superfamily
MSTSDRLARQLAFLIEADRLKSVFRRTWLLDESRLENDAEHSWHAALAAIVLGEYAEPPGVDLLGVLRMLLVHDLVEIDAGDTYAYDEAAVADQAERERRAADRIFGLLDEDQGREFRRLWEEFDARQTPTARFAAALDRLLPLVHNYHTRGREWLANGVTSRQVVARVGPIAEGSPALWEFAQSLIRDAVAKGYLAE